MGMVVEITHIIDGDNVNVIYLNSVVLIIIL